MSDLVPFREDFTYRPQKRKDSASSKLSQIQVAGADFETKDGYPHIYTLTQYDKTCLLYTSPSPRDRQKSRMPSSA